MAYAIFDTPAIHGIPGIKRLLPSDSLLFLMDLSIEPTLATLRPAP